MRIQGSITELVSVVFREDGQALTLRPNQATTYTASRDLQLPPGDAAHVLMSADSTQIVTGKTISGVSNTITNVSLTTGVTGTLPIANGGTAAATKTDAFDSLSPTTTKGDLIANNGSDNIRVPVGTDGQVLTAASGQASGLQWTSPLTNPMDSTGDLIKGGASGAATKLDLGTANQVLVVNSGATDIQWSLLTNSHIDAAAAIAGTKISPNFGSQAVSTTGTLAAGAPTFTATTGILTDLTALGTTDFRILSNATNGISKVTLSTTATHEAFFQYNHTRDEWRILGNSGTGNGQPMYMSYGFDSSGSAIVGALTTDQNLWVGTHFNLFLSGDGAWAMSANGSNGRNAPGVRLTAAHRWLMSDGDASTPGWSFISDPDTGIYRSAVNTLDVTTGGTRRGSWTSAGLQFQNGSSSLSYYEEGNWTPGVTFSGVNTPSISVQTGRYTRIGRVVTVDFQLEFSKNGSTGNVTFTGLPFTVNATVYSGVNVGLGANWIFATNEQVAGYAVPSTTTFKMTNVVTNGGRTDWTDAQLVTAATVVLYGQITYQV